MRDGLMQSSSSRHTSSDRNLKGSQIVSSWFSDSASLPAKRRTYTRRNTTSSTTKT